MRLRSDHWKVYYAWFSLLSTNQLGRGFHLMHMSSRPVHNPTNTGETHLQKYISNTIKSIYLQLKSIKFGRWKNSGMTVSHNKKSSYECPFPQNHSSIPCGQRMMQSLVGWVCPSTAQCCRHCRSKETGHHLKIGSRARPWVVLFILYV